MKRTNKRLQTIELDTIKSTVESSESITDARDKLKSSIGAVIRVKGKIQKLVKRDQQLKFVMTDEADAKQMLIFADMRGDAERVKEGKYRKGRTAEIVGRLVSFGYLGINLGNCKLVTGES